MINATAAIGADGCKGEPTHCPEAGEFSTGGDGAATAAAWHFSRAVPSPLSCLALGPWG